MAHGIRWFFLCSGPQMPASWNSLSFGIALNIFSSNYHLTGVLVLQNFRFLWFLSPSLTKVTHSVFGERTGQERRIHCKGQPLISPFIFLFNCTLLSFIEMMFPGNQSKSPKTQNMFSLTRNFLWINSMVYRC